MVYPFTVEIGETHKRHLCAGAHQFQCVHISHWSERRWQCQTKIVCANCESNEATTKSSLSTERLNWTQMHAHNSTATLNRNVYMYESIISLYICLVACTRVFALWICPRSSVDRHHRSQPTSQLTRHNQIRKIRIVNVKESFHRLRHFCMS